MASSTSVQRAIKIYARIKPSLHRQTANYELLNTESTEEEFLTIFLKQNADDGYVNNKPEQHSFRFSKIFDRHCNQDDVFLDVAKPVIDSALQGYNGTIFAYGQTGSGKTYTMTGSRSEYEKRGIIPRTLSYVFRHFQQDPDSSKIRAAFVSYLEIYNEGGYDLLHSSDMAGRLEDLGKVTLLEDGHQQMHLRNLSVHPIGSEEEALQLLYLGDHNRTVAETPLNEASTRSHCIFTIHLNIREANTSIVRRSKLHLVDLAGSERVSNSSISGQLLNEARHINLALHYLEQVIVALSDTNRQHIPYRNSMMTSVLRDSLGGNCMTSMIATLSLEPFNVMESLSTCRFSQRVAMVTNAAMPNEELDPNLHIQQLKAEVRKLKETIASASIKPGKENNLPLTVEEYNECREMVERFLLDPDPNAVLAILPDMRLIQSCFRLLKTAHLAKRVRGSSVPSHITLGRPATDVPDLPSMSRTQLDMTSQELLQTINRRDIEIKVLVEMLRKEKLRRGVGSRESLESTAGNLAAMLPTAKSECDTYVDTPPPNTRNSTGMSKQIVPLHPARVQSNSSDLAEGLVANAGDDLMEMSDVKKLALSEFLETYEEREKLETTRNDIFRKREEVTHLEQIVDSSEVKMHSLSGIYTRTKEDGLSEEADNIKTALESQERTCMLQMKRLQNARRELDLLHDNLRMAYHKLMIQFEKWWQNTALSNNSAESRQDSAMKIVTTAIKQPFATSTPGVLSMERNNVSSLSSTSGFMDGDTKIPLKLRVSEESGMSKDLERNDNGRIAPAVPPPSPWNAIDALVEDATSTVNSAIDLDNASSCASSREEDDAREKEATSAGVPLTGDPSTDQEILKFFEARKKAALKMKQSIPVQQK